MQLKNKLKRYMRVVQIARKPSKDEYTMTTKICAIGMVLIGLIGFVILLFFVLIINPFIG